MSDCEIVYLDGWKSKDDLKIYETIDSYKVIEHRKDKESMQVKGSCIIISKENVRILWKIFCDLDLNFKVESHYIWKKLIIAHNLAIKEKIDIDLMCNFFNGGKYRRLYYFTLFYYPTKVLEAKGLINYFGRGACERIADKHCLD